MLLALAPSWLVRRLWRLLRRRFGGDGDRAADATGALAAYVRLIRLLRGYGLDGRPTETPREFARRAAVLLGDRTPTTATAWPSPTSPRGSSRPSTGSASATSRSPPRSLDQLDRQLDALEAGLRPAGSPERSSAIHRRPSDHDDVGETLTRGTSAMRAGLVGFAGGGKSTLFQLLTGATPDPGKVHSGQVGIAELNDPRLDFLAELHSPKKVTRANRRAARHARPDARQPRRQPPAARPDPQGRRPA